MLQKCENSFDQTGASVVAIVFLSVFVALVLGDAVLTAFALNKTLNKDVREEELTKRVERKTNELHALDLAIAKRRALVQQNNIRPRGVVVSSR